MPRSLIEMEKAPKGVVCGAGLGGPVDRGEEGEEAIDGADGEEVL